MKTIFLDTPRPRDIVLGWSELSRLLGRTEDGARNAPPNWLAAVPCWKIAGVRCWDAGDIADAIAGSKPTSIKSVSRDPVR